MTSRTNTVTRLATAGFVIVLVALATIAIGEVTHIKKVSDRVERSSALNVDYSEARDQVASEDFWVTEYLVQLVPNGEKLDPLQLRIEHAQAAAFLTEALSSVRREGTPADRQLVAQVLAEHRSYLTATDHLFRAVDRRNARRAFVIELEEIDPTFSAIVDQIEGAAAHHRKTAKENVDALNRSEDFLIMGTLIALAVGLFSLTAFWAILRGYRRRADEATQAELAALERSGAERQRALEQVQRLSERQDLILNSAGEGIYALDSDGRATLVNAAAAEMTGHTAEALLGQHLHELVHHTRADGMPHTPQESPVLDAIREGKAQQVAGEVFWRKDGTSFPVEYTATPIMKDAHPVGAVVVFKDITERREIERAKDEFTSIVSHELRTPLTSIRGSLGLLESGVVGRLPEKGQRMVEIAVENTDRLVRLINDILDIERINSGKIDMHQEPCDAAELIDRAIESVGQVAAEADVKLIQDAEPAPLFADPDRVLQTLTNLISNAVKFSSAGSRVNVSAACRDGEVLFEVRDEGRGIPADKLTAIFERFQQVDASDSREKGGTGLGLAICRTIVEHHGGRIWVESELGAGSTFSFVLPAQAANGSAPNRFEDGPAFEAIKRENGAPGERLRVLIVEDDRDLGAVLTATFERHGIETFRAADGRKAIELSQKVLPDLLVLDLGLPGADGFQVVDWLRQHERLSGLPTVVYTARELDETDRVRLRLGTTTEFLTKGRISPQDFEQHVMHLLGHMTRDPTPETSDEPQAHPVG